MEGCSSLSDHLEVGLVLGVIEASKFSVIDAKSVDPDMEDTLLGRGITRRSRNRARRGFPNAPALDAITTEGLTSTAEEPGGAGSRRRLVL
jgi:hypothetical protein